MDISPALSFAASLTYQPKGSDLEAIRGAAPALGIAAAGPVEVGPAIQLSSTKNDYIVYGESKPIQLTSFSDTERADGAVSTFAQSSLSVRAESRLQNAPLQLGELLKRGDTSYTQDVRQYTRFESFDGTKGKASGIDLAGFNDIKNTESASLKLQLTTKDGDQISFSLKSYSGYGRGADERSAGFEGVEIAFEFEGELSQEEQEQVDAFIEKLTQASNGYFNDADIDMEALDLSSFSSFSEVELSLRGGKTQGESLRFDLSYSDSEDTRTIKVNLHGDRSEISVDKQSLGASVSEQQMAAVQAEYLELLNQSADEAHAKDSAEAVMTSVFSIAFNRIESPSADAAKPQSANGLVGLPDFDFTFKSKGERPNKEYRPLEYQGFALTLSLDSQVVESDESDISTITQTQKFELNAAYYSPAGQMEWPDFDLQTYQYTQLDRSSEKVTQLVHEHDQLISAITNESGENKSRMLEYQMGKVVDEDIDDSSYSEFKEFTEEVKADTATQDLELLDLLVLDPFQEK